MEPIEDLTGMLNLMVQPAFCVTDGKISHVNLAAQQRMIPLGLPIREALTTGIEEYEEFTDGTLYLTLSLGGERLGASVVKFQGADLFRLEHEEEQENLQALALAAQELRKPLGNVMAMTDQFFPQTDPDPAQSEQMARINRGLYQMLRIIGNMSDAYRYSLESAPHMETRDVCDILSELFSKSAELIRHTGVTLRFKPEIDRAYTLVDTEKLERAVSNMLSNALKFTPSGGSIDARLSKRGRMLYLTLEDSGSSVDPALRSSVFSRFQRSPGLEDSRHGIGLGLVFIRSAAALHGGTVLMEYPGSGGTRITMSIAITQSKDPMVRSPRIVIDYAGERDHQLIELSDALPAELYNVQSIN